MIPLTCRFCGKIFTRHCRKTDLKRHEDAVHLKLKPYKCLYCGKAFALASTRSRHIQRHHCVYTSLCERLGRK